MHEWHSFNFQVLWPEGQAPKWWVDILILDGIVRPVLAQRGPSVGLWRIHRRAFRDAHGHELTFDCLTARDIAGTIDADIRENKAFHFLRANRLLEKYSMRVAGPGVDAICDKTWPTELQAAWPSYINGVCVALLRLTEALKASYDTFPDINASQVDVAPIERSYQELDRQLAQIWQDYGHRAVLHHVNAIFAYQPVMAHGLLISF